MSKPTFQAGSIVKGEYQMVWEDENHHLSIDVRSDGTIEWFHSNRKTGIFDGEEGLKLSDLCAIFLNKQRR